MGVNPYAAGIEDHEFSTGRTFRIRTALPMTLVGTDALAGEDPDMAGALMAFGTANAEDLNFSGATAARLVRHIVEAMFVRPRVAWGDESVLPDGWDDDDDPEVIPSVWLQEAEVQEVIEIARLGIEGAARFRAERDGTPDGEGGEGVEQKPKRSRGGSSKKRTSGGARTSGAAA